MSKREIAAKIVQQQEKWIRRIDSWFPVDGTEQKAFLSALVADWRFFAEEDLAQRWGAIRSLEDFFSQSLKKAHERIGEDLDGILPTDFTTFVIKDIGCTWIKFLQDAFDVPKSVYDRVRDGD